MIDRFRLYAKGGEGGSGCSSSHRSRHDRHGRPDGGFSFIVLSLYNYYLLDNNFSWQFGLLMITVHLSISFFFF